MMTGGEGTNPNLGGLVSKITRTENGNKRVIVKGLGLRAQSYDYDLGKNNQVNHVTAAKAFIQDIPGSRITVSAPMMEEPDRIDSRQFVHVISY